MSETSATTIASSDFRAPVPPTLSSGWPLCEHLGPGDLWHCAMNIIGISSPMDWLKGKSWKIYRKPTIFPWNMGGSCNFSLKPIDISFLRATLIFFLPLCQLHFGSPQSTRCCGCGGTTTWQRVYCPGTPKQLLQRANLGAVASGHQLRLGIRWCRQCKLERERENTKKTYIHTHNYYTYTYTYTYTHIRYITLHYNTLG